MENEVVLTNAKNGVSYFRPEVTKKAICKFSCSLDGKQFVEAPSAITCQPGRWVGAKAGMFCTRATQTNDFEFCGF